MEQGRRLCSNRWMACAVGLLLPLFAWNPPAAGDEDPKAQGAPTVDEILAKIDGALFFHDRQDGLVGYEAQLFVESTMVTGGMAAGGGDDDAKADGVLRFDAGMAPENVTGPILRAEPEVLLLADATDLGAEKIGTVRLLRAQDLAEGGTSTHDPSLRMLLAYLAEHRSMDVHILAAQAGSRALGAPPSPAIVEAVEYVARILGVDTGQTGSGVFRPAS